MQPRQFWVRYNGGLLEFGLGKAPYHKIVQYQDVDDPLFLDTYHLTSRSDNPSMRASWQIQESKGIFVYLLEVDGCICPKCKNEIETKEHIITRCPSYNVPRDILYTACIQLCDEFNCFTDIKKLCYYADEKNALF